MVVEASWLLAPAAACRDRQQPQLEPPTGAIGAMTHSSTQVATLIMGFAFLDSAIGRQSHLVSAFGPSPCSVGIGLD